MSDNKPELPGIEVVYDGGMYTGYSIVKFTFHFKKIQYGSESDVEIYELAITALQERIGRLKKLKALKIAEGLMDEEEKERESGTEGAYTRIVSMLSKKQADEG